MYNNLTHQNASAPQSRKAPGQWAPYKVWWYLPSRPRTACWCRDRTAASGCRWNSPVPASSGPGRGSWRRGSWSVVSGLRRNLEIWENNEMMTLRKWRIYAYRRPTRWSDDLVKVAGMGWMRPAQDWSVWRASGDAWRIWWWCIYQSSVSCPDLQAIQSGCPWFHGDCLPRPTPPWKPAGPRCGPSCLCRKSPATVHLSSMTWIGSLPCDRGWLQVRKYNNDIWFLTIHISFTK